MKFEALQAITIVGISMFFSMCANAHVGEIEGKDYREHSPLAVEKTHSPKPFTLSV